MQKVIPVEAGKPRGVGTTISAYINLMKPHVTVLLLGVTLAAMVVALNGLPPLGVTLATLLGGLFAAGSANAINCYWDRDIDELMSRTKLRTIPSGKIEPTHALIFGVIIGALSVVDFGVFVNLTSAALALSAILFYVLIYTMWLKRTTTQNIVIGGAAGAVPALIGWAAVAPLRWGPSLWTPLLMFAVIFLWTPPHFWALSIVLKKDYARAKVPMLPVVRGDAFTYQQIIVYSIVLVASSLLLFVTGGMGYLYLVCAIALGAGLLVFAIKLGQSRTLKSARTMFWFSNYYLALLFAVMALDHVLR
ncbi:MAG TPA: heme o synthase [Ktedonobacterales bacterium]|jgi:protoheme IX farnesyltransferase|nr:heme o synthase [Ktedonobacterales bacterium]